MDEGFMLRRSQYACVFREAIESWREAWGDAGLPVVFAQLHGCGSQKNHCTNAGCTAGSWTTIRSAQADVLASTPQTGMAVAYDQGFEGVHSPHKQAVAYRLGLEVLRVAYGANDTAQGPIVHGACLRSLDPQTNATVVELHLANTQGLMYNDTRGCSDCCGEDSRALAPGLFQLSKAGSHFGETFVDATMRMEGSSVLVSAAMGPMKDVAVFGIRYAYGNLPQCAIFNGNRLPLAPFNALTVAPSCKPFIAEHQSKRDSTVYV